MNKMISTLLTAAIAIAVTTPLYADDASFNTRVAESKAVTGELLKTLGGALKKEMQANGPAAAVGVCKDIAPDIANKLSLEKGWQITRISERPRNALLGTPDQWEQKVMNDFKARAAKGEKYQDMYFAEVVDEPNGKSFRFLKAVGTMPICTTCHGSDEQIPPTVKAAIDEAYPHDRAKGFKIGDLRGAVSIKQGL